MIKFFNLFILILLCLFVPAYGDEGDETTAQDPENAFSISKGFSSMTVAEKKQSFRHARGMDEGMEKQLSHVNQALAEKKDLLQSLYYQLSEAYYQKKDMDSAALFFEEIKLIHQEIAEIQRMWRDETSPHDPETYALWHQPETTILQLVMDYGGFDAIYLVPPEIALIAVSINSNILIPRESWEECLELILQQNGIGIRVLNPFLRELYRATDSFWGLKVITDKPEDLPLLSPSTRICFVLSSDSPDPSQALRFLQNFSNATTTAIRQIGGKIFIASSVEAIQELLKLYDFVKMGATEQECQVVSLSKLQASEMELILNATFSKDLEGTSLHVIPLSTLSQSLFVTGTKSEVKQAIKLIRDLENQIEDPREKTIFWYTVKHSDAEELATVLAKVYDLLACGSTPSKGDLNFAPREKGEKNGTVVPATHVAPSNLSHPSISGSKRNNFIVDPKTGSLIMVIEQEALPKIKELLKRLDVPKKMIQIEVLLFEKKFTSQNRCGLNLLRLGSSAFNTCATSLNWNTSSMGAGILEFLMSRSRGSGIPAYDFAYHFLLGQEDVQINASPSTITMNQTPVTMAIVEEISVNAGADEKKQQIYNRAQYGITIQVTPSINVEEPLGDETPYVTLDTNITFDTTKKNANDRPDVTRRHIKNHVRIADGQTVILGGLRRKNTQDNRDSIPFLGEIPGIGKLFSSSGSTDSATEMFVFITPKIISDPIEDLERVKRAELAKRPGDVPEFLTELTQARQRQKKKLFERSLHALFGSPENVSSSIVACGEYDGRN